ncbi:hypothetical protein [Sphingobacterium bovistauri]|uniref:Uncharacterized protein n=1 Tax=Sphingobacterium bovistauri TaxID=2781959 RepID=A0ABS7Z343_9SPHI|nr:hypothetical protein [Sphingobacterium bovistauri]MCA5004579.1 hypothetical protein [Sphingobacterium bovistauri]
MIKSKLIDSIQIGQVEFEAYITIDENNLEAFAVYLDKSNEPLLVFQQISNNFNVEIKINQKLVDELQQYKSKDIDQRKEHYKIFQEFVLNAEQKAKEIAFQDTKLNYFTDIKLIKSIEQAYLID